MLPAERELATITQLTTDWIAQQVAKGAANDAATVFVTAIQDRLVKLAPLLTAHKAVRDSVDEDEIVAASEVKRLRSNSRRRRSSQKNQPPG